MSLWFMLRGKPHRVDGVGFDGNRHTVVGKAFPVQFAGLSVASWTGLCYRIVNLNRLFLREVLSRAQILPKFRSDIVSAYRFPFLRAVDRRLAYSYSVMQYYPICSKGPNEINGRRL